MVDRDFTPIASIYDSSRQIPPFILDVVFDRLLKEDILPESGKVLDVGCGTGQLANHLAKRGYNLTGIDVSREMLNLAKQKLGPGFFATFETGFAQRLSFADNSFDLVVASKLFQHISKWRDAIAEIVRVSRPATYFVHINESGAFRHSVRRKMEEISDEAGFTNRYVGTIDQHAVASTFVNLGCERIDVDTSDLNWSFNVTFREAIEAFENRLFAEFWSLPDKFYLDSMKRLRQWASEQKGGMDTIEQMKPVLKVVAFKIPM